MDLHRGGVGFVISRTVIAIHESIVGERRQGRFKVRDDRRVPGGRHDRVNRVLLLGAVHLLHVDWRSVLGLWLGMLTVRTRVHSAEAILPKESVDGLNAGHDWFPLEHLYFLS